MFRRKLPEKIEEPKACKSGAELKKMTRQNVEMILSWSHTTKCTTSGAHEDFWKHSIDTMAKERSKFYKKASKENSQRAFVHYKTRLRKQKIGEKRNEKTRKQSTKKVANSLGTDRMMVTSPLLEQAEEGSNGMHKGKIITDLSRPIW